MKIKKLGFSLAVITALGIGFSGCGSSDSSVATSADITTAGSAVDGYLVYATVCLDLNKDGYCQIGTEPAASTDVDGAFSLNITTEQQKHVNYDSAPLLVYGGYDKDTNTDFTGKLKASFSGETAANITPVTTMVEAIVSAGKTKAEAETSVKTMLGFDDSMDLGADPVKLAKTNSALLKGALKLQKALEVLANAKSDANATTADKQVIMEGLYSSLATKLKASTGSDLNTMITDVVTADANLSASDASGAIAISGQIEAFDITDANTANFGSQITQMQRKIKDFKDVNTTFDSGTFGTFVTTMKSKDVILLHAEEIMHMVHLQIIKDLNSTDFNTVAGNVKIALSQNNGMTETSGFLPIEDEITRLKAYNDNTVKEIGTAFESMMSGFKNKADQVKNDIVSNSTNIIDFPIPLTVYNFGSYTDNDTKVYKNKELTFSTNQISFVKYNTSNNSWILRDNSSNDLELKNGAWVVSTETDAISKNSDGTIDIQGDGKVTLVSQSYISGKTINEEGFSVSMPSNSMKYGLKFERLVDSYRLHTNRTVDKHDQNGTQTPYTSYSDFISTQCNTAYFISAENSNNTGLAFAPDSGNECNGDATSGTLSESTNGTVTTAKAGTWELKTIGGNIQAIIVKPNSDKYSDHGDEKRIYSIYNDKLTKGDAQLIGSKHSWFGYNKIASDAIKAEMIK